MEAHPLWLWSLADLFHRIVRVPTIFLIGIPALLVLTSVVLNPIGDSR